MLGDIFKFEKFNLKHMWDKAKDNPEQLLLGAADPAGAKFWSGITGKDYEPIVNEWGGATDDSYKAALDAGIDTRAGKGMHGVAQTIAGLYTGKWLGGIGGDGGATSGATGSDKWMNLAKVGMQNLGGMQQQPAQTQAYPHMQMIDNNPFAWQQQQDLSYNPYKQAMIEQLRYGG